MELYPSEVRERVLADHSTLHAMMDRLEVLARKVLQGRTSMAEELRKQARLLDRRLREHMELEERILVPALREADGWGPERVARFHDEHRRQRDIMDGVALPDGIPPRTVEQFALIAWGFVQLLRDDIHEEERISLNEDVLRDDLVHPFVETD